MPPRKPKVVEKPQPPALDDTPIVFFLKILENIDSVTPAGQATSYSDILNAVEATSSSKFDNDLMKSVLEKVVTDRYTQQTACFWCCHGFNWHASVLPIYYDTYKNVYVCEGNFCSPECALAHNYADPKTVEALKWNRHSLLQNLYSAIYTHKALSPAPPRTLLRMFGGPLSIEQYRDYTSDVNDVILSDLPPVRLVFPTMNIQGPLRDIKKYVSLSTDVVEKANEQLRLKRSKPTNVTIPTLDMCIKKA